MANTTSYTVATKMVHDYNDYGLEAALLEGQQTRKHTKPDHNDPFPVQLHWMLEQTEKAGLDSVCAWSPHGRAFAVHNREEFVEQILPIYFNQTKITSFQRQCSLYGFKRITKGPDSGSYYHPMFLRNSRTFVRNIVRTKIKNNGPRKAAAPEAEPDLYSMPRLPEPVSPLVAGKAIAVRRPSLTLSSASDETLSSEHLQQLSFATRLRSPSLGLSTVASDVARVPSLTASLSAASMESDLMRNRLLTNALMQQQQQVRLRRLAHLESLSSENKRTSPLSSSSNSADNWLLRPSPSPSILDHVLPNGSPRSSMASFSAPTNRTRSPSTVLSSCGDLLSNCNNGNLSQAVSELIFRRAFSSRSAKPCN